ncbi:GTP-binding protein [Ruminococcus flavefaciens]|uniref:TIGR03943 family putative permease subunit n=1 Tax=Ruminococcus flavefaciens TaxID=1265 RepID=UPI0026F1A6AF|nr:GTP-binding protein [Ruminococcus flavefaciens]MDD7517702.1 GTP-binding protein [Ruminococcus flavefaciens]MDY5690503.1 GTP-binding protein [Ruminococcus flavefaciens]
MPNQDELIPIYLFLGFLESGKTKFIQETLEDRRFNKGEKTLLLVCEEGIEEFDISKMPKKNITVSVIEDKSDFTMENFTKLLKESGAERVVVEYNGMWTMDEFFKAMPDETTIAQVMCFVDATTFTNYNANMRSLVVDKFNNTEMVVFNRFDEKYDPNEFHKIVRGVSRRAEIVYEYADGRVAYDDIEDPLPFDVEADEITIEDKDFALWYRDIMDEPMKYDGKTMTFKALIAKNSKFPENTFAVGRHIMTCCVEDIQYCWLVAQYEGGNEPENKEWITVTGKISVQKHKLYRGKGPVLYVESFEKAEAPEQPVATFY